MWLWSSCWSPGLWGPSDVGLFSMLSCLPPETIIKALVMKLALSFHDSVFLWDLEQVFKCLGFEKQIKSHTFILRNFHVKASLMDPQAKNKLSIRSACSSFVFKGVRECPVSGDLRPHSENSPSNNLSILRQTLQTVLKIKLISRN